MKTLIRRTILPMAMTLAAVPAAWSQEHHTGCSNFTLRGLYAFNASGFNILAGVGQPKAIVELIRFNEDGTVTVPAATRSANGAIVRSPANGVGNYTLAADCTGSLMLGPPGPTFDLFVMPGGWKIRMIQITDPTPGAQPVLQGIAERIAP